MRVCLFEDHANDLEPLSLTRPVFQLVCGRTCLGWKQLRALAPSEYGLVVRPHLAELARLDQPALPVNDPTWIRAGATVFVNGRWLPPEGQFNVPDGPRVGLANGEVAFAVVGADQVRD